MTNNQDVLNIIETIEKFLPVVTSLVTDLKGLVTGAGGKTVDEILNDADANWEAVIDAAKAQLPPGTAGSAIVGG
jgi:hypothetical protein